MECSTKKMSVNRKWMLCSVASFVGFFFLVFCIDQGRRQGHLLLQSVDTLERRPPSGSLAMAAEGGVSSGAGEGPSPTGAILAASRTTLQPGGGDQLLVEPQSIDFELFPTPQVEVHLVMEGPPKSPPPTNRASPRPSTAPAPATALPPSGAPPPLQYSSGESSLQLLVPATGGDQEAAAAAEEKCNIFEGKWVHDAEAYPLYRATQCPFLSAQVSCQKNGRPDSDYEHWRWQPSGCDIPRFDGRSMLERLRGKRVVIVGDSLNRNQWESLSCLLYSSVRPSRAVVKAQGADYKVFRALDYNCTVEFFWSPFLVRVEVLSSSGKKVIQLDKLPPSARRWQNADVMVFNTGHWWTHSGKMRSWDLYQQKRGGELVEDMDVNLAFQTALRTWSRWVDKKVDPAKTRVFFRSVSPEHKPQNLHWCYNQTHPITNETYIQWFPRSLMEAVEKAVASTKRTPVEYLNITRLSEFRREAHTSVYTVRQMKLLTEEQRGLPERYADCSHWCLPGLPDTWNVLLYASMLSS